MHEVKTQKKIYDHKYWKEYSEAVQRMQKEVPDVFIDNGVIKVKEDDKRSYREIVSDGCDEIDYLRPIYDAKIEERENLLKQNEELKKQYEQLKVELKPLADVAKEQQDLMNYLKVTYDFIV